MNTTTVYRYLDKLCAEHTVIKYPDLNSDKAVFQFAGEEKKCAVEICFMESARTVKKKKFFFTDLTVFLLDRYGESVE